MLEILLCIEHDLVRTGLRTVLESQPGWTVVCGTAGTPLAARSLLDQLAPDLVVADFPAAAFTDTGNGTRPAVPIVLVGFTPSPEEVRDALRSGARGVVLADDGSSQHVIEAVRALADGHAYLAPAVTADLLDRLAGGLPALDPAVRERLDTLTEREREVLELIACGRSTAEVARRLHLSPATVKSHLSHTLPKLGVQDRAQAVAFAHRAGLVTSG
jgi:DNA-binding NarL/FixJ family response regulator